MFATSAICVTAVCVPIALYPVAGARVLDQAFVFITEELGIVYILFSIAALALLLWLAFSRFGRIKLGRPDQPPDFGTFSWSAMLFSGGIGTSVLYWGTIEWAHYYQAPPFEAAPLTDEALRWSMAYPIFHWGITGWALYCLPAIAMAYAYYVRDTGALRLSAACRRVLGASADGRTGRLIDLTYMIGLVGATSTGIGLAVPLIAACFVAMTGIPSNFELKLAVVTLVTVTFGTSVWLGLSSGIKHLSNAAVWLAFALLAYVLLAGPTRSVLASATDSLGFLVQNFVRMSVYTDPSGSNFVASWTVFYWAWWLALGPFMGIFITKISGGRTIRQVILGSLGYGTLGCVLFFAVLGGYAAHLALHEGLPILASVNQDPADAVVRVIAHLPNGSLVLPLFAIVCVIFAATSYDSASYTLASSATRTLGPTAHPARWHRLFWAAALGVLPVTLMYLGGLRPLQSAVIAVSLPLLVVVTLMTASLLLDLREHKHS